MLFYGFSLVSYNNPIENAEEMHQDNFSCVIYHCHMN